MYLDNNQELALFSCWAKGSHKEDIGLLDPCIFEHKKLFKALQKGKDIMQIIADGEMENISYAELLSHFDMEYWQARAEAIKMLQGIYAARISEADGETTKDLTEKINKLQAVIENRQYTARAKDLAENFLIELENRKNDKQALYGKGFKLLDYVTSGIHKGQLIVLGARPAVGKSAMALQMAYNVASQGNKVLYMPLEMTTQETLERLLLQQQIIEKEELEKPTPQSNEKAKLFLEELEEKGQFIIYEGLAEIDGIIKKVQEEKPYLIVLDQLTQIRPANKCKDIREKYGEITSALKALAMIEQTAIILLTQLNRKATESGRPSIENLHEADSTGQNADVVLIITREEENEESRPYNNWQDVNLYIAKQRQGKSGVTIPLKFIGDKYMFIPVLNN